MPDGDLPVCFEPYLRYAISTEFKNFELLDDKSFDDKDFKLFLLVEFNKVGSEEAFAAAMAKTERELHAEFGVEFGPDVGHTRHATMRSRRAAVVEPGTFRHWNDHVSRVELSLPVRPSTERLIRKASLADRWNEGKDAPGSLLIGILDDGCPFAAAQFLKASAGGAIGTRVRGIWDQNQGRLPVPVSGGRHFGQSLTDFTYGLEYRRDFAASLGTSQMGLDEWIGLHSTSTGSIDEDGCYADAKFKSLARGQSHGAHVMDVFAGRVSTSSRVGPSHPGDRRDPPNWTPGTDLASSADVVFVQFSEDCIRDATGVWLKNFVLNGIQYILSFAHPTITKEVVINLSYGPTTGPHDGTAQLEAALTALVTQFNGSPGKPRLEIVLPAGNTYSSDGHVVFTRRTMTQPDHFEWNWRLPPDNAVLCFAEIWMQTAAAGGAIVTLTSPTGATFPLPPGTPTPHPAGVDGPLVWGSDTMWRLQVEPTIVRRTIAAAEHGDWKITVTGIGVNAEVHAYVARSDPNMGVRTGAKRSYFVDQIWDLNHSAVAACNYTDGEFDKSGSLIHCDGTLNGIATAKTARVHVAGGYIIANGRKSPYSSAGPARRGPRIGPDFALPCDESYALGGLRAGGNRSGAVFRLTGTSAAAPQLARHVTNPPIPSPKKVPTTPGEIRKRGGGNLEPP